MVRPVRIASLVAPARVVITSLNPVKVNAAKNALNLAFPEQRFEFQAVPADSRVADQPIGDEETLRGARNRISSAQATNPGARVYMSVEGGVGWDAEDQLECFAWAVVRGWRSSAEAGENEPDMCEMEGKARTASFPLPEAVAQLVKRGVELGEADDRVFGRKASGRGMGTVGLLTHGHISRQLYYEHAFMLALVPFLNPDFY